MESSRQEYWSGLPFPPPGDFPDPGIEPESPALAGRFFTTEPTGKPMAFKAMETFLGLMGPKMELPGGAVLGLHVLSALLRVQAQCSVPVTHRMTAGYGARITAQGSCQRPLHI